MNPEDQYKEVMMDVNSLVQKIMYLFENKIIDIKNFNLRKK